MSFSVYTSCAINYLPKARALAESLRRHAPDATLTLCLNDIKPSWLNLDHEPFDRIWFPSDLGYDSGWIFQHNVMELCTAVKGRALCRLFEQDNADLYLYLDPDVFIYNSLDAIKDYMDGASIGLIPHILRPEETDIGVRLTEMSVTMHGTYNLGHLFIRKDKNGIAFANWWSERLDHYCFDDRARGLFTDQRWVDLAPAIFDGVKILRHTTLDVASWNLFGRKLHQKKSTGSPTFTVDDQPLITYHFSGTGRAGTHQGVRKHFDPGNGASAEIERLYEETIAKHGQSELSNMPWGFDCFDDGKQISPAARSLYRNHSDLQRAFPEPFRTKNTKATLCHWLQNHRPDAIRGIRLPPDSLERAFNDLFDEDYYLSQYPEAKNAISCGKFESATDHYRRVGSMLMMDPNAYFNSSIYIHNLQKSGMNLSLDPSNDLSATILWSYLTDGLSNGIEATEHFDSQFYLRENADVMSAFKTGKVTSPLSHYLHFGRVEGRKPGPNFSVEACASPDTTEPVGMVARDINQNSDNPLRRPNVASSVSV